MTRKLISLVGTPAGLALLVGPLGAPPSPRLVWNASASAPLGLYVVSPRRLARPGDTVIADVPARYGRLAATRGYLPAGVPLVKQVAAGAGSQVCARGRELYVDGVLLAHRLMRDAAGRPMPWWDGCMRLRAGQVLLLNTGSPASFDGRYFGVSDSSEIVGVARLIWAR